MGEQVTESAVQVADAALVEAVAHRVLEQVEARERTALDGMEVDLRKRLEEFGHISEQKLAAAQESWAEAQLDATKRTADVQASAADDAAKSLDATLAACEKVKSQIEAALRAASTAKASAETEHAQVQALASQVKTALDAANTHKGTVVSLGERAQEVQDALESVQSSLIELREQSGKHEAEWKSRFDALFKKVEGLLPGATSAGLATGFREEKDAYETKQRTATWAFVTCLVALGATLAFAPLQRLWAEGGVQSIESLQGFLMRLLWNLPLVAPSAWGAWWFNRRASIYERLSEEYRHKEAVSKSFDGYTSQLRDLEVQSVLEPYLARALAEICAPPAQVYQRKPPAGSPLDEALGGLLDTRRGVKSDAN